MTTHAIVSREKWLETRRDLLVAEKDLTHRSDQVAELRRKLPWVRVDKPYVFEGPNGKVSLADLFAGRDRYVVRLEIPGVSREEVKVYLSGTECVVVGERLAPQPDVLRPLSLELPYGRFERRFPVPMGLRQEQLTARWSEGVLELRLDLDPAPAPKITPVDIV